MALPNAAICCRQLSQVKEAPSAVLATTGSGVERIPSGPAPPASPFGDEPDNTAVDGDDFEFSAYGPVADREYASGAVHLESQFSGMRPS